MSTIVKICKISQNFGIETTSGISVGLACITNGLKELNYAFEKDKEILDCDNQIHKVKLLIKTLEGKQIGVIEDKEGLNFVVPDVNCAITQAAIKKIKQRYSKYVLLHELESKGYAKIKEEKLPNGKIRMVVEKWE
jgi:Protein of unknown function (DUF1257)